MWRPLLAAPFFAELERGLAEGRAGLTLSGLAGSSRSLVLAALAARDAPPLLLIVRDDRALDGYRRDLTAFAATLGGESPTVRTMEALDADPYDGIAPHPEIVRERVATLTALVDGRVDVLVATARALLHPSPALDAWRALIRTATREQSWPPDRFVLDCLGLGYRRVDTVGGPAEISRRGGIVDIFPPTAREPVRIEFFGDEIESLRTFDTDNQRSTGELDEVRIVPANESPPTEAALARVERFLESGAAAARERDEAAKPFRALLDTLQNAGYWPGFESLAGLTAERAVPLLDNVGERLLVVDDVDGCREELARAHHDLRRAYEASDDRVLPPPDVLYVDPLPLRDRLDSAALTLADWSAPPEDGQAPLDAAIRPSRHYDGRIPELIDDLREARGSEARTVITVRGPGSVKRVREILAENDLAGTYVFESALREGFEAPAAGLQLLTERDVFGERKKAPRRKARDRRAFVSDFRDLKVGDRVVHVDHGVARYEGLGRPKGGSLNRDFMTLVFADGDRLFVPVDRLDLVQKYSGVAGKTPGLDKLGGPGWERAKRKARKAVESMARELLELYAKRKATRGHIFGPDTPWQQELEDAFPYELTVDQARTLEAIKADMESPRVMDRLLVGDVGFGKTEVALRSAFKAVMDGKQVALLAPTTVLAMQHFETLRARFAPFPVRVEMVSRFRSAAETQAVLRDVTVGQVDVLIGTHRMLGKDVKFKDLGLLVIDEEQRFGVKHKEKLQSMAIGVDVLAMTATPIPRTLQMSMAGVRDLSVIETPPPGRTAIQTYLMPFRGHVVAQAIRQELRRDGQIFFVHNDIETLPALATKLQELVPEVRILSAHGRMPEGRLERVMLDFVSHEADLLLTTTIIENGLDIPRANTILVNRADRFGLAQLYQLRGRVGRSRDHAYAYFIIPGRESLSDQARKRLKALEEFSDLGAGFRLAAADLEIRGAGELLGSKQHGHIASLGFDLYCQLLERTVRELGGEEPLPESRAVALNLGVDIKLPETYLADAADRLVLYKRLAQAADAADVQRLKNETEDRFGHLPDAACNLFEMAQLRIVAQRAAVKSVDVVGDRLQLRFHEHPPVELQQVVDLVARERGTITPSGALLLPAPPQATERLTRTSDVLQRMLGES